jgi:hypothetical protein
VSSSFCSVSCSGTGMFGPCGAFKPCLCSFAAAISAISTMTVASEVSASRRVWRMEFSRWKSRLPSPSSSSSMAVSTCRGKNSDPRRRPASRLRRLATRRPRPVGAFFARPGHPPATQTARRSGECYRRCESAQRWRTQRSRRGQPSSCDLKGPAGPVGPVAPLMVPVLELDARACRNAASAASGSGKPLVIWAG